ncbi:hypothetical protein PHYC_00054 [Phycisphaerales bacterium]|nr:hypothetical protein PHYC_00054 [Phycisphaerales bacterium]
MVLAILQFELLIPGAESLKDKRRVVNSLKDRLHREHQVSVAEVGLLDTPHAARMALALVTNDGRRAGQTLDRITTRLRALNEAELGDCSREILHDPKGEDSAPGPDGPDRSLDSEMLRRALDESEDAA